MGHMVAPRTKVCLRMDGKRWKTSGMFGPCPHPVAVYCNRVSFQNSRHLGYVCYPTVSEGSI